MFDRSGATYDQASAAARAAFEPARTPRGDYAIHTEIRFTVPGLG